MGYQSVKPAENPIVWADLNYIVSAFASWDFFKSQSILITGGNGLLASYLVRTLLHANHLLSLNLEITCLVRNQQSNLFRLAPWLHSSSLSVVYGDVETFQYDQLEAQSIVIHAASGATPSVYHSNPVGIILPNSVGTAKLCQYAQAWNSQRFLFFSTGEVYGVNQDSSFAENNYGYLDPASLRSCYAESKRCGESTCVAYAHQYGLHTVIARIFHTYGPQMKLNDGRVFADFVRDALEGKQINVVGSGEAMRCFCYLSDATHGFLHLLVRGSPGEAYNLSNPSAEISICDLATLIAGLSEPPLDVCFAKGKTLKPGYMPSPVPRSLPSIAKAQSLGWEPLVDLHQGFSRTLASYII